MKTFRFYPSAGGREYVWSLDVTAEDEDAAWEVLAEKKQLPASGLKTFITIKELQDDPKHASGK